MKTYKLSELKQVVVEQLSLLGTTGLNWLKQ
jgi:hypothetical protein